MFSRTVAIAKQVGIVMGAITAFCGLYASIGLPMPVSQASVDRKIEERLTPLGGILRSIQQTQITILGDVTTVQRQILRNERLALEGALNTASAANKIAFNLRLAQIEDELAKLDRRESQTQKSLEAR